MLFIQCLSDQSDLNPLDDILLTLPDSLQSLIDQSQHEIQILYTKIDRDEHDIPHLTSYFKNYDNEHYFYPASTVKMPVAFLALQRINQLRETDSRINRNTRLKIDSVRPPQSPAHIDSASFSNFPNVATYTEKVFSVSDNDAYNRLYEFLGQDYINEELRNKGIFKNSRISTRVGISGFDTESNKYTNPVQLLIDDEVVYAQGEYYALYSDFPKLKNDYKGQGYFDSDLDSVIYEPFDMSQKNFINLIDLEASLRRIIFPELFDETELFNLSTDQYQFLYDIMPKTPLEFEFNRGHEDEYYDSYVKFFYNGDNKDPIPDNINIYNKVGWAYGTLTDCAYIVDIENGVEFFLSATILINENRIFNDGIYEYEELGLPFLSNLGKAVYQYELKRKRKYLPSLSKFK